MSVMAPPAGTALDVAEWACRAPTLLSRVAWRWRVQGTVVDLCCDRTGPADPARRSVAIGCGAALHHARVAARTLGWDATVERHPSPGEVGLLARLRLAPLDDPDPDRGPRSVEPPRKRVDAPGQDPISASAQRLAELVRGSGADAVVIEDPERRRRIAQLVRRAHALAPHPGDDVTFAYGGPEGRSRDRQPPGAEAWLVLGGSDDDVAGWLRSGEALGAIWLADADAGVSIRTVASVLDTEETVLGLRSLLENDERPHVLLRLSPAGA